MSEATADSLIPASSSAVSSRCASRERSPGDCRACPSDITKLADRLGWSKRAPYQTVRAELGQPGCVGDIGFATGEILHVPRIDWQHFKSRVLRQVVDKASSRPGGRHYRTRDPLGDQMLTQCQDLVRHRAPRRHRLNGLAPPSTGDPHAHLGVLLRDIQPGTTGVNHFHALLPSQAHACRVRCGEGRGDSKSLTLGLDGTNPRFPWTPSVTMLNYRLADTTECIGIDHNERGRCPSRQAPPTTATSSQSSPTMVRSSRRRTAELRRAPSTLHFAASFLRHGVRPSRSLQPGWATKLMMNI
jgi:hypothetical protein